MTIPNETTRPIFPIKIVAMLVFILLPFLAFWLGFHYEQNFLEKQVQRVWPTPPMQNNRIDIGMPPPSDQPVNQPPNIPPTSSVSVLTYNLPSGWQLVQDDSITFEVGYNPAIWRVSSTNNSSITIGTTGTHYSVSLLPYNGGSRHQFIYDTMHITNPSENRTSGYHEANYTYNGWSCLVLYNFAFSASGTTWGMCAVDNTHAFFFDSIQDEQIIRTVKLLKTP